ncbi:TetR/AcrR family transcriptional regulator [Amycolatopsis anabasis]|uniref:TetR/AcrR family transcriptional regulator n=1 Tax=Amycolatopsis anabasis TaxID=1840409 RepID=UPI00131D032F|nr:TetR/AcrR family transcriptional regulator [Amycolatopsis anabasis]
MNQRKAPDPARRSQRSRQAILGAAFDLLGEVGYRKLTIEAIAARAGVGKQTIYRWWPSKGAVVFDAFLALSEGAEERVALPDTGDLEADLRLVVRATVAELTDPRFDVPYRVLLTEFQQDPQLTEEFRERLYEPLLAATRDRFRRAQAAGQLAADLDLDAAFELLWGPIYYRWLLRTGPLTESYADTVTDLTLAALRPR